MSETTRDDLRKALIDTALLWQLARVSATDVSMAAANALTGDLDSPSLRELAGVPHATATFEVPELWPKVCDELSIPNYDRESDEGALRMASALARALLRDGVPPRHIAAEFHRTFSHGKPKLIETIVCIDDEYDYSNPGSDSRTPLDAELFAAVGRLLGAEHNVF